MKKDSAWLNRVVALGCIVCGRAACVHHPRFGQGKSQRADDRLAIPLCSEHHQYGGFGVAIHAGQKTWEKKYGTEIGLLEKVYKMLGEHFPPEALTQLVQKQKVGSRLFINK